MLERNTLENKSYKTDNKDVWLSNFPKEIRGKLEEKEMFNLHELSTNKSRFDNINKIHNYKNGHNSKIIGNECFKPYNPKHLRKRSSDKKTPISGKTPQDRLLDSVALGKDLWTFSKSDLDNKLPYGKIKVSTSISFKKRPIFLDGLEYSITIGDGYIYIGCCGNTIEKWKNISDKEILEMDGKKSLSFWRKYKSVIIKLAETFEDSSIKDFSEV